MKASVLVNGSPTREFSFQRGLRHGDPLSPLLFNLVGEVFHALMKKTKLIWLIERIYINEQFLNFSHLQFADDTIIFLKPGVSNISNLKRVLQRFQLASGLKINFNKSSLYTWGELESNAWANLIGCKEGELPIRYLGADIGSSPRKLMFWKPLINKIKRKLASWKCSSLNKAGRKVLVKACLNNLPVYWFHLHNVPKGIVRVIERKRRDFF